MQTPLLYEKIRARIYSKPFWAHPELRVALAPYHISRLEYPSLLQELRKFGWIKISNQRVTIKEF